MPRASCFGCRLSLALAAALLPVSAQERKVDPLDSQFEEEVGVRLVVLDILVLDEQGRTVPDLTLDDFVLKVDGEPTTPDTLDVACPAGAADDPVAARDPGQRVPLSVPPEHPRRIVVAFDYQHLRRGERVQTLHQTKQWLRHGLGPSDEVMLAALVGGLRIEQAFTRNHRAVLDALERMEYDVSLWMPEFQHLTERPFFESLKALMEVLAEVDGPKAMVLYSSIANLGNEPQYRDLASVVNAARCAIYPVQAEGLPIIGRPPEPLPG